MKEEIFLNLATMPRTTSQQKGVCVMSGKPRFYVKHKVESARRQFIIALKPHAPKMPSEKNIRLSVSFYFDIKEKAKWGKWKPTRPDADGIIKEFMDAMTDCRFWKDDSQVVWLTVKKTYAEKASIFVRIEELEDAPI